MEFFYQPRGKKPQKQGYHDSTHIIKEYQYFYTDKTFESEKIHLTPLHRHNNRC